MNLWIVTKYTGWLLMLLMIIYIATGFSYAGYFGFETIIDPAAATSLHSNLIVVGILIILICLHCCLRFFLSLKNRFKGSEIEQKPAE
jgi:hypothetical protein